MHASSVQLVAIMVRTVWIRFLFCKISQVDTVAVTQIARGPLAIEPTEKSYPNCPYYHCSDGRDASDDVVDDDHDSNCGDATAAAAAA